MEQAKGKKILSSRCVPITSKKIKKKEEEEGKAKNRNAIK
jgi:hypothetical protein